MDDILRQVADLVDAHRLPEAERILAALIARAILESLADDAGARRHHFPAFAGYLRAGRQIGAAQVARRLGHLDLVAGADDLDQAVRWYTDVGDARDAARGLSEVALEYGLVARDRGDRATAISLFREALGALREADDPGPASRCGRP